MDFGKLIKDRRTHLGLTLEQVGDACGVGKSTVRKWEEGMIKNLRRDKLKALANILQIDPVDLIDTDGSHVVSATLDQPKAFDISDEERLLVIAYRQAPPEYQAVVMDILSRFGKGGS